MKIDREELVVNIICFFVVLAIVGIYTLIKK